MRAKNNKLFLRLIDKLSDKVTEAEHAAPGEPCECCQLEAYTSEAINDWLNFKQTDLSLLELAELQKSLNKNLRAIKKAYK